jgi:pantoate--beta-alanine ligase
MQVVHGVAHLRETLAGARDIAFVPTMGNLHAGHLSLIQLARQHGQPVVASIFVNPMQFGAGEDFERYPRTLKTDCDQLEAAGCDLVFAPDVDQIYPEPQAYSIAPPLAAELCGAFRPGHFAGVCTVVLKLFNMVQPRYAVFGKKDYQQLFILQGLVHQFNLPITVLAGDTGRAGDGLALSSRNVYLTDPERAEAPRLYQVLQGLAEELRQGIHAYPELEAQAAVGLAQHGWHVDYIAIRNQHTLLPPAPGEHDLVILAAAHLGHTRLIDNLEVRLGE